MRKLLAALFGGLAVGVFLLALLLFVVSDLLEPPVQVEC